MTSKNPNNVIDKLKFYREIAQSGLEYTPPPQFFVETEELITALIKEVNQLRGRVKEQTITTTNKEQSQDGTT